MICILKMLTFLGYLIKEKGLESFILTGQIEVKGPEQRNTTYLASLTKELVDQEITKGRKLWRV